MPTLFAIYCIHEWVKLDAWVLSNAEGMCGRVTMGWTYMGDPNHVFHCWNIPVSLFKGKMVDQSPKITTVARNSEQKHLMLLSLGWGFWNHSDQQPCDHVVLDQAVTWMDLFRMMNFKLPYVIAASLTWPLEFWSKLVFHHFCPSSSQVKFQLWEYVSFT